MPGWYRGPGAGSPGHRGQCRPGADNAAPRRGTAAVPARARAPHLARRSPAGSEGTRLPLLKGIAEAAPAGPAWDSKAGRRPSASPSTPCRLRVQDEGGGKGLIWAKPGASPPEEEPGEAGSGARGGPSRKPLNPCAPARPPGRSLQPPRPGAETCSSPAAEPKARCPGQEDQLTGQLLRAFRGHHPWKHLENFIPFLSLGPQEHRTGTEDCPNGWLD